MRKLAGLQFRFAYKKGSENKVANALSRVGSHFDLNAVSVVVPIYIQEVLNSYHTDIDAMALLQELAVSSPNAGGYSLMDGVIRYKTKIWVGNNTALQTKLITTFHASTLGGHSDIQATHHKAKKVVSLGGYETVCRNFHQAVCYLQVNKT
jgi:hypothetical protein